MAHVQINRKDGGGYAVVVDGVDIGQHVMHDGFSIEPTSHSTVAGEILGWVVHLKIFARSLDADLPDAVVVAERQDGES